MNGKPRTVDPVRLRTFFLLIATGWTIAIGISLAWDLDHDWRVAVDWPCEAYNANAERESLRHMRATSAVYIGLWLVGLAGVALGWRPLRGRIQERQQVMQALSSALATKEVLLREVHHRVKNNLQIISSLLNMQADTLPAEAQEGIEDSQRRVRSMALVHEQLYSREHPDQLDFGDYAATLASDLFSAYSGRSGDIRLKLDLDSVLLNIDQAIPCGLILNELVTNSLKYAFPAGRSGEIRVGLHSGHGAVELQVADTGVGLPAGLDCRNSNSLGLRIVDILTNQLNGMLRCRSAPGAEFLLTFPARFTL